MSSVSNPYGGKTKAQGNPSSNKHSVVFFGYELSKKVTKNDILLFFNEHRQTVINIEVVCKRKGNFAKITFVTSAAAQAAIKHYNGQHWYKFGVCVALKPWEEKSVLQYEQEYGDEGLSAHDNSSMVDSYRRPTLQCTLLDGIQSQSATGYLPPYPMHSNTTHTKTSDILSDSHPQNYENSAYNYKEYTIKISGLSLNVRKQEIDALVIPFGDLTSPIKINRYRSNNICYAYVNYLDQHSAIAAVSKLDGSELNGMKIHVCHKGQLEVYHNCRSEHRALNASQRLKCSGTTVTPSNTDTEKFRKNHVLTQSEAADTVKMTDCLSVDHWNKFLYVNTDNTSIFSQLVNDFAHVRIDLDHNKKSVSFTGLKESVQKCRNRLFNEIYQNLHLSNYQMLLLVIFEPNLVKFIKTNWSIEVTGFHDGSTCLIFKGDNIQMAYNYITKRVGLCKSKEFPCQISSLLVKAAIMYIKRVRIPVIICNTEGKELLPIISKAKSTTITMLVVHSLSQDYSEINNAIGILRQNPYRRKLDLYFQYGSHDLENKTKELQSQHSLVIQILENSIVIQGYAEKDVITAFEALKKIIDKAIITVDYECSKEEMQYLQYILFEKPTDEAKKVLKFLSKSLSVKVHNTSMSITLTGDFKAINEGTRHIDQLLNNFMVKAVCHRCHSDFLSQIEKYIKEQLEKELNVVVYYFPVHGSEKFTPTRSIKIYTKVYSTNSADFRKACDVLNNLDPQDHCFSLNQEEFTHVLESGTTDLNKIGDSNRVRIELQRDQNGILMHAFTQKEAQDCFWSLKQSIASTLNIVSHIHLTSLQLKYMQNNTPSIAKSPYIKVVALESSLPKLKIEGSKAEVEKCTLFLQQLLSRTVAKSHKLIHHKYILMWKKCWQKIHENISQDKDLYSELTMSVSGNSITCKLEVIGEKLEKVDNAILSAQKVDGSIKEYKISTDILSIKAVKDNLKSKKLILGKDLIYHIEFDDAILIVSPYCTQAEEIRKKIKNFLSEEKMKRKIITKRFEIATYSYTCIIKELRLHWNKVQDIAKGSKILSINFVTNPCCAIEVKGNEAAIKQAEPQILQHISFLENKVICSVVPVDYFHSPALKSTDILQLCKELESELSISIMLQIHPKVLSSATVCSSRSDVVVEICEGSIVLDKSDIFVNFTDANLSMSKDLKFLVGKAAAYYYKCYMEYHGPQSAGKALCPIDKRYINQKIIHAVMPKWIDGKSGESDVIVSAVIESLKLAVKHKATSVSLPFLGCVDKSLPIDYLADACLTAVYLFCAQFHHIKNVRLVLPINMAEKFHENFTVGLFKEHIEEEDTSVVNSTASKSVESTWLWENDHGDYVPYSRKENTILNQKSSASSSCNLAIERFSYVIDFVSMTQTNTKTKKIRKIKEVINDYVWALLDDKNNWKHFASQKSKEIEIMYVTGKHNSLVIDGQCYIYDFSNMVQINKSTFHQISIKRMPAGTLNSAQEVNEENCKSNIILHGSVEDIGLAKERLNSEIKSLIVVRCIDVQPKFFSAFGKHRAQIQNDYKVEISQCPSATGNVDLPVKYNVTGFKGCVQEAIAAIYQALTSFSNFTAQSFPKPIEWEPQSSSIELKDVSVGSPEWIRIRQRVQETIPSVNLVSIKRIQNEFLWEKYCQHKERMSRKGLERVNEMELFHGTSTTSPEDIYKSEEGFDMRFSRSGMWGKGNYFAESARYSCSYAYKKDTHMSVQGITFPTSYYETSTIRQIFLVKVLTGDSYTSPSDKTLRMPPYKALASSEKVRYDTVNGMAHGSKIYITYSNDKAYPLYLISLKIGSL